MQPLLRVLRRLFGTERLVQEVQVLRDRITAGEGQRSDETRQLAVEIGNLGPRISAGFAEVALNVSALTNNIQTQSHEQAAWLAGSVSDLVTNLQAQTHQQTTWLAEAIGTRLDRIEAQTLRFRAVYLGRGRVLLRFRHLPLVFLADANDRLIVPHLIQEGEYETEVTAWLLANVRTTDICLDVGANLGYHSCIMAYKASEGRVIAVEPDPDTFGLLVENVNINWLEARVQAEPIALSEIPGQIRLHRLCNRSANTSIGVLSEAEAVAAGMKVGESFVAPCSTLDELMTERGGRLDLIKLDVEGAEALVLRGARRTIEENPTLRILMEWSPEQVARAGGSADALLDEIRAQGLEIHRLRLDGTEEDAVDRSSMLNTRYWNLVLRRPEPLGTDR